MMPREPIAIVGIGCRFPGGVETPEAFWELIINRLDVIQEIPSNRFDVDAIYDPTPGVPGKTCSRWGGFIDHIDQFDASFFGISPRESSRMDPQQRLLLETTWDALNDAGLAPTSLAGSPTGVFVAVSTVDYEDLQLFFADPTSIDIYALTGGGRHTLAGRLSYALDVSGPSVAVDTACSSSLVAVHMACQSLYSGECNVAIVGAVNLILAPEITIGFSQAKALSPDGRCKFGDSRANGFVRSDGVGAVVLKPLSRAQADGDPIYAVIKGSAVNNDGRGSGLLTVPSQRGQEQLLREAYRNAGVLPGDVQYVEAHGTGTSVGDPVELRALGTVLQEGRISGNHCFVGSVKTNIGHTEAAAGLAGLIKVALSLKHQIIPPGLHFDTPNPQIPWKEIPLHVATESTLWFTNRERPLLAGVSAFGISGTNAHVVLTSSPSSQFEDSPPRKPLSQADLFVVSAHTPAALQQMLDRYYTYFTQGDGTTALIPDICYSAGVHRDHYDYRIACVTHTDEELVRQIKDFTQATIKPIRASKLVFVFPGQGSQWIGMGRELLKTEPIFQQVLVACDQIIRVYTGWSLLDYLQTDNEIDEVDVIQPAIFAIQVALAALWRSWGIEPDAVVGQSMGEIAAAHVAGALNLEDAAKIICQRSQLVKTKRNQQGAMAVVGLSLREAHEVINGHNQYVSVAVSSSPQSTVLSGDKEALEQILEDLADRGVFCRPINVDYASHSPHMDPLLPDLLQTLAGIHPSPTTIPLYSTVTGEKSNGTNLDVNYWLHNLRKPVLFADTILKLLEEGHTTFVEISPHPIVLSAIQQCLQYAGKEGVLLPSLRRDAVERDIMLESLGRLYTLGYSVNWSQFYAARNGRYQKLPPYAWQREHFWTKAKGRTPTSQQSYIQRNTAVFHPLLSGYLRSALHSDTYFWQIELDPTQLLYLQDHQVRGKITMPTTAFLEMGLAAAAQVWGRDAVVVEEISLKEVLHLSKDGNQLLQVVFALEKPTIASFQVFSLTPTQDWLLHANGRIRQVKTEIPTAHSTPTEIQLQCPHIIPAKTHYQAMDSVGIQYGPAFQGIQQIWKHEHQAIALITLPEGVEQEKLYHIHPALLDACLQVILSVIPEGELYLPVSLEQLRLYANPDKTLWSHVILRPYTEKDKTLVGDITLYNEAGQLVAEVIGLHIQYIQGRDRQHIIDNWLYHLAWEPAPQLSMPSLSNPSGKWLLLSDTAGTAEYLQKLLTAQGEICVTVHAGDTYEKLSIDRYQVNPYQAHHFDRLLTDINMSTSPFYRGIIHLWGVKATSHEESMPSVASLQETQEEGCGSLLYLVQALAKQSLDVWPRLWLANKGSQQVQQTDDQLNIASAPLWGLGRTIAYEHPDLRCTNIDLSSQVEESEIVAFCQELFADLPENHIAFRGDNRYVGRLQRHSLATTSYHQKEETITPKTQPFSARLTTPGVLDNIQLQPVMRARPGHDEVEIEVLAAGLNFSDVMKAMGVYPSTSDQVMPLGIECAGIITAVGEHVTSFAVGDEVVAIACHAFSTHTIAPVAYVSSKPSHLSFVEAATLPVAYLTAYYALHELGRLRPGDRLLIHAASGGVGLAAIQIGQYLGAEIFVTAGTTQKREYLRSLGIQYVMDSRSLTFADEIMSLTHGEGVDVILNSLAGAAIDQGLQILRPGGRFLELGKRDIYNNRQVGLSLFKQNIAFFAIDLDPKKLFGELRPFLSPVFQTAIQTISQKIWQPLPYQTFPISKTIDAFRHMAQAQHIGKIVILPQEEQKVTLAVPSSPSQTIRPDGTYLITGGLGGLGLAIAQWMVDQGVKHLVLMGRRGVSSTVEPMLQEMGAQGVQIVTAQADVADTQQIKQILEDIRLSMPPLRGIIHAAGLLDDGILLQLNWERFKTVMAPKINGAWNLHSLTLDAPLDFFVMFSSAASLLGSGGQGNYAAANAFLDALAHYRQAKGLPGLSINWGPWSDTGLAARPDRGGRLAFRGMESLTPKQGVDIFARLIQQPSPQMGVMPMNWARWQEFYPEVSKLPWLAHLTHQHDEPKHQPILALSLSALQQMPPSSQLEALATFIADQVAQVLGLLTHQVDVYKPLINLGMDSLMAVELKNRIHMSLGLSLLVADLLKGSSVIDIATKLLASYLPSEANKVDIESVDGFEDLLAQVEQLTEEEVHMLLGDTQTL